MDMKITKSFLVAFLVFNAATAAGISYRRVRRSEETNACEGRQIPCQASGWGSDRCLEDAQAKWNDNNCIVEHEGNIQETFGTAVEIVFKAKKNVLELQHDVVDSLYGNLSTKSRTLGTEISQLHPWNNTGDVQVGGACLAQQEMTSSATQLLEAYAKLRFIISLERRLPTQGLPTDFINNLEVVETEVLELLCYVRMLQYGVHRADAPLEPLDRAFHRESQRFCRCVADDIPDNRIEFYYHRVSEIRTAVGHALGTLQRCVEGEGFLNRMLVIVRHFL